VNPMWLDAKWDLSGRFRGATGRSNWCRGVPRRSDQVI
jgi:hypothetical protein